MNVLLSMLATYPFIHSSTHPLIHLSTYPLTHLSNPAGMPTEQSQRTIALFAMPLTASWCKCFLPCLPPSATVQNSDNGFMCKRTRRASFRCKIQHQLTRSWPSGVRPTHGKMPRSHSEPIHGGMPRRSHSLHCAAWQARDSCVNLATNV